MLFSGLVKQSGINQLLDKLCGIEQNKEESRACTPGLEAIVELKLLVLEDEDPHILMDQAVSLVTEELGVEYGKVFELQPDGESLLLRSGIGWEEGLVGRAIVRLDSPAGRALASEEPVILEDLLSETRFCVPPLLREHGVKSGVTVPIQGQEQPFVGVLGADTTERRAFTEDEIDFLRAVSNVLAVVR